MIPPAQHSTTSPVPKPPGPIRQWFARFEAWRGRRIYIMPTRFGYIYALALLVMQLGAINYSNSLAHLLCFLLASLGLVTMLHTWRNIVHLEITAAADEPVFAGQPARFVLRLDNLQQPGRQSLKLHSRASDTPWWRWLSRRSYQPLDSVEQLAADELGTVRVGLPGSVRGLNPLGTLRLSSEFPLGLFTTWTFFASTCNSLAYPRPDGVLPLPAASSEGVDNSGGKQPGVDDFAGLDNYRPGDPLRAIAWKALARDDELRSKRFSGPQHGRLWLSWFDTRLPASTEARLSQLCRWVLLAANSGHEYGLELPGQRLQPAQGDSHRQRCLRVLALYEAHASA